MMLSCDLCRPAVGSFGRRRALRRRGAKTTKIAELTTFTDDATDLDSPGRPRVIQTPVHSPATSRLPYLPDRGVLIAGDAAPAPTTR